MSTVNHFTEFWDVSGTPIVPTDMSEEQFAHWALANENMRAEWVDGKVVVMSPVSRVHSALSIWLGHLLSAYLEVRPVGELLGPEFMIRLAGVKSRRIPDLLFVSRSRAELIKSTYLDGAPDLAIEIVSQDSQARDWREKYLEYEAAGVREYWIVDPFSQQTEAYCLVDDAALADDNVADGKVAERRFAKIAEVDGRIASTVLEGFAMRNEWLWATPRPTVASLLKELGLS